MRLGYGMSGAAVGALYGLFLVWIAILAIRLLGSVAETQIAVAKNPRLTARQTHADADARIHAAERRGARTGAHEALARAAARRARWCSRSIPIPGTLYGILHKLGVMVSDEKSVDRFLSYPGVQPLLEHPKIAALQNDPDITRDIINRNYLALIRNPRIVTAANDTEIGELMRKFEFEKALDYAIAEPEGSTEEVSGRGLSAE